MAAHDHRMSSWTDFNHDAPDLAARVRKRFEAHGLGLLATLRADGSPRINGIEPVLSDDGVWLGMMPDSLKSRDLRRDPRLALHSATVDKAVTEGDARISGRAIWVDDPAVFARFGVEFETASGQPVPPGPFDLWEVDVTEVTIVQPAGDHLDIEVWTPDGGHRVIERR